MDGVLHRTNKFYLGQITFFLRIVNYNQYRYSRELVNIVIKMALQTIAFV